MSGQGLLADQGKHSLTEEAEMIRDMAVRQTNQIRPQEPEEAATATHP